MVVLVLVVMVFVRVLILRLAYDQRTGDAVSPLQSCVGVPPENGGNNNDKQKVPLVRYKPLLCQLYQFTQEISL